MAGRLLAHVARILNREHVPYMVIGGQAVLLYGEPRLTKDIDITLGIDIDRLHLVEQIAREARLEPIPEDIESFVKETSVLPAIHRQSGLRVDFIFSFTQYESGAIKRGKAFNVAGEEVRYAALEDVIIHKMVAGRARDAEDVKGILNRSDHYDREYVLQWLKEFSTASARDLVEELLSIEKSLAK